MKLYCLWGFPGSSVGKESPCNARDLGLIPRFGRSPGAGHSKPLHCYCLENPHEQRSLVGYSPWDCKELDLTELTKHSTGRYNELGEKVTEVKSNHPHSHLKEKQIKAHLQLRGASPSLSMPCLCYQ